MKPYQVENGKKIVLNSINPEDKSFFDGNKEAGIEKLEKINLELESLQELLYAEHRQKVLVVLQAMDTGGKDGAIRRVFEGVNPQGVKVVNFKVPTQEELDHDYLWRVHRGVPGKGEIVIFNRSHYEDLLVVRVHNLVPKEVWSRRFDQINNFERMLFEEGTTILKFYLHIDKDEQKKRLRARLDDPSKRWKFNVGDIKERATWDQYLKAYEDVLRKTSTKCAPWFIIPANRKWYRDLVISEIVVETLRDLNMSYPQPCEDLSDVVIE